MPLSKHGPILREDLPTYRQSLVKATQFMPQFGAAAPNNGPTLLEKATAGLFKLFGGPAEPQIERVDNTLNQQRQSAIGFGAGRINYLSGFPQDGHGHKARQLPVLQFISPTYQPVFSKLGLATLADFLGAAAIPQARQIISHVTGIPRHTLLLTVMRAEFLDLPLDRQPCQPPHINDVLLLAEMGLHNVAQLGVLQREAEAHPIWNELLLKLIALVQKAHPEYCGKQRITRMELRDWGLAAERRGSDIHFSEEDNTDSRAEVLLTRQMQERTALGADILLTAILTLHLRCYRENLIREMELEESLANDLPREYQLAFRYYRKVKLKLTAEQEAPYSPYIILDAPHSLLFDLWPRLCPGNEEGSFNIAASAYSFFPSAETLPWTPKLFNKPEIIK